MIEEISLDLPRSFAVNELRTVDLAALVAEYSTTLFRVAHSVLRSRTEAEDVVQDAFVRVLENQHKLPLVRDMRPWLVRIAWNLALDRQRKVRPEQIDAAFAEALVARAAPADTAVDDARRVVNVLRAMDGLRKNERQVLLLSALEELDATEIGVVMGKSPAAVRGLLLRARIHLRSRLETRGPEKGGLA